MSLKQLFILLVYEWSGGVQRFYIKICDELLSKLSLNNRFLSNLRFLKPENITMEGNKMINCAKKTPISKLSSKDFDCLNIA